ncbi:hypothetical protein B296_00047391 [Ensete ventricosum]|uniref:Uncharacterized protein n=1 Tax=Ensete ventricosum TaxID=4639 RepID=A0A426WZG9_ENSVE|nr:hypothetical protein B296_00047391 [Ensete ventricosum]
MQSPPLRVGIASSRSRHQWSWEAIALRALSSLLAGTACAHGSHRHCWRASLLRMTTAAFTGGQSHDHHLCTTAACTWKPPKCDLCPQAVALCSGAATADLLFARSRCAWLLPMRDRRW